MMEQRYVRFGAFRADRETGELWHADQPVRLRRQPARLLSLLISRPNQLVTHDVIIRHLWGDRIVEYDQGVHACIRQIRAALHDRAAAPRWIETIPKSGYRFIGRIEPDRPPRSLHDTLRLIRVAAVGAAATTTLWTGATPSRPDARATVLVEIRADQTNLAAGLGHELALLSGIQTPRLIVRSTTARRPRVMAVTARDDTVESITLAGDTSFLAGRDAARRVLAALVRGSIPADSPPHQAREAFLQGQFVLQSHEDARLETALDLFGKVIGAAPDFAPAHAALARVHLLRGEYPPALRAAERAMAADSGNGNARLAMANMVLWAHWDRAGSAVHHRAALEQYPGWSMAHVSYAFLLAAEGRHDQALAHARLALELDPVSPIVHGDLGLLYLLAGQFKPAAIQCRRTLELDPSQWFPRRCVVDAYLAAGDSLNARDAAVELMQFQSADDQTVRTVQEATPDSAMTAYWRWTLSWAAPRPRRWYPYVAARAYMGLKEYGRAVTMLTRGFDEHTTTVIGQEDGGRKVVGTAMFAALGVDPRFAPLHSDTRFAALLERLRSTYPLKAATSASG